MSNNVKYKEDSYRGGAAVTPSDSVNFADPVSALYIGGAGSGNLTVVCSDGNVVAFAGLTANTILPICATRVNATGTDVTSIVGLK